MDSNRTSPNAKPYTYLTAGFNRFFSRSIGSESTSGNLLQVANMAGSRELNFDQTPTSGNLGDIIQVGGITIDGTKRRISIFDETGVETGRIGRLDD